MERDCNSRKERCALETGVTYDPAQGAWRVTCYAPVLAVLHEQGCHRVDPAATPCPTAWKAPGGATLPVSLLRPDAADGDRVQYWVSQVLTPQSIDALGPGLAAHAHQLLDGARVQAQIDLVSGFALPLLIDACAELLGVPVAERPQFGACVHALAQSLEVPLLPTVRMHAAAAGAAMAGSFSDLLSRRRRQPGTDLLSALLAAPEEHDRLSHPELLGVCMALVAACYEVGNQLIAGGAWLLWQHPAALARLRQQPQLWPGAVEELLRYLSPIQGIPCVAREDLTLGGQRIRQGELVLVDVGSANRDPQVFSLPDRLDITRTQNPHLALGGGRWWQPGAPLIRQVAQVALSVLAERLPVRGPRQPPPAWGDGGLIRSLKKSMHPLL